MKLRLTVLALILALVGAVSVVPARANAAATAPKTSGLTVPFSTTITNTAGDTVATVTSATITRFTVVNGVLTAVGTLNATNGQTYGFTAPVTDPPTGSCQILDLTIGPISLDLLGLQVTTDTIHLNITAQSGSGNLLGNLLCSVAHLLDQNQLSVLANLLNQILGLLQGL